MGGTVKVPGLAGALQGTTGFAMFADRAERRQTPATVDRRRLPASRIITPLRSTR